MDGSYARIQIGIRQMTCADSFSAAKKKEEEEEPKIDHHHSIVIAMVNHSVDVQRPPHSFLGTNSSPSL
ncbi:hypothetical protein OUZ56_030958 [Daphnia magna]|uniref:Uncharacterized protein n=1 Tax=Daphnia magna TaxID=35525 RepID=A0ABQ9ZSU0_9CRUS|nr:hypothetical protein OUZ56_030958 [Daphnia magna]